jgi:hypothetical protein
MKREGFKMDHVIESLREWLRVYEDDAPGDRDEKAIRHIKQAINELNKYYGDLKMKRESNDWSD